MMDEKPSGRSRSLVEERRWRIYQLYLKGFSESEIAQGLQMHQSNVSRALAGIRRRNASWFKDHREPDQRYQALFKETYDQVKESIRESWRVYHGAETPGLKLAALSRVQQGIALCSRLVGISAPSLEELYWTDKLEEMKKQGDEIRKKLQERRPAQYWGPSGLQKTRGSA